MAVKNQDILFRFNAETGDIEKVTAGLIKDMEKVADAADEAAEATEEIGKNAKKSGGLLKKAGQIGADGFKLVGTAIAATGLLGLVTKVLMPIIDAFLENKKVADTLKVAMAGIGAVIDTIIDLTGPLVDRLFEAFTNPKQAVLDLAEAIRQNIEVRIDGLLKLFPRLGDAIKAALRGNFKEAGKIATDAVGQVALGVENVTDKVADVVDAVIEYKDTFVETVKAQVQSATSLEKAMIALDDRQRDLNVRTAQARAEVEELKRQRDDERLSIEERIAAAEAAAEIDQRLADENVAIAEERARLLRQEIQLQGETEERLNALAEAEIAAADARGASSAVQTELMTSIYGLNQELITQEEERLAAEEEARLALEERLAEEQKLKDEAFKADQERRAKERQEELDLINARFTMAANALGALQALNQAFAKDDEASAEKAFRRNKALSLATAVVNTGQAVVNALTAGGNPLKLATGAQFVEAGIAAAVGAAQIATIARSKFQSSGGAASAPSTNVPSSGAGGGGTQGPGAPTLDLGFLGAGAGQSGPIQAYVLAENVSNAQQANQKIQDQATL